MSIIVSLFARMYTHVGVCLLMCGCCIYHNFTVKGTIRD